MSETNDVNKFLIFTLGDEAFAVDVFKCKEILDVPYITRVPGAPEMFRGMINVRGSVVPVIDLHLKFGTPETGIKNESVIIITEMNYDEETVQIGLVVDKVDQVISISNDDIEEPPKIGTDGAGQYIEGIGKTPNGFILILNTASILTGSEVKMMTDTFDEV